MLFLFQPFAFPALFCRPFRWASAAACLLFAAVPSNLVNAQEITRLTALSDAVSETSGMIFLSGRLITHNDSGGEPALYEIDTVSGAVLRKVVVRNARNIDWEDICHDDAFIYIGDIGNNDGSRRDLSVYRLSIADYLGAADDTVTVDTIRLRYADQTDFTPRPQATNFDAESLIAYGDSLYLFTKNWGDFRSAVYPVPKVPGDYTVVRTGEIEAQGLVTGADYNPWSHTIVLVGYTALSTFVVEIREFTAPFLSQGLIERHPLPLPGALQAESIAAVAPFQYYLSTEGSPLAGPSLYRLGLEALVSSTASPETLKCKLFPNPASQMLWIEGAGWDLAEFYDVQGKRQKVTTGSPVVVSDLRPGFYLVVLISAGGKRIVAEKLLIE